MVEQRPNSRGTFRAQSTHVVIVLPHTDGDLARVLSCLEERLLLVDDDLVLDDDDQLPDVRADREAIDAVGRLSSYVADVERQPAAVQPVAPDGRFELVPLLFVPVARRDLDRIVGAIGHLTGAVSSGGSASVAEALCTDKRTADQRSGRVTELGRLEEVLQLPWDDDVDVLHQVLDRSNTAVGDRTERVVLTVREYAAYQRVTKRILATWHRGDSLAGFLYWGVG